MRKNLRLTVLIISVTLVSVLLALSVGLTAAIWTSQGSSENGNTVAPATDSPFDWNMWAKYFDYAELNSEAQTVAVSALHADAYGLNLETVIIPSDVMVAGEGGSETACKVTAIRSSLFSDVTLKDLPITIYIPPTVESISAMTFANMPNLEKVIFGTDESGASSACVIDDYAFYGCPKLTTVVLSGRTNVTYSSSAFVNCGTITFA